MRDGRGSQEGARASASRTRSQRLAGELGVTRVRLARVRRDPRRAEAGRLVAEQERTGNGGAGREEREAAARRGRAPARSTRHRTTRAPPCTPRARPIRPGDPARESPAVRAARPCAAPRRAGGPRRERAARRTRRARKTCARRRAEAFRRRSRRASEAAPRGARRPPAGRKPDQRQDAERRHGQQDEGRKSGANGESRRGKDDAQEPIDGDAGESEARRLVRVEVSARDGLVLMVAEDSDRVVDRNVPCSAMA